MEKNIYANLNLTDSISEFQEDVKELLDLTKIEEWDGRTVKEREEKIREAALVLAGQCIAILLHKLSQSESAQKTAINQTKGYWYPDTKRHGCRKREILTVGNVLVTFKLPYFVNIKEKSPEKNKSTNQGFCPWLQWLGMSEGLTPLVWSTIAKYGAIASSFEAAHTILSDWGIDISLKRI